jgi:hypothetical protein
MTSPRSTPQSWHTFSSALAPRTAAVAAAVILLIGAVPVRATAAGDAAPIEFNRDIRPILSENCFACHGPDSAARKADLRLDRREAAVELGAIVPNDPEASELVARLDTDDASMRMPPRSSHKTLTTDQKDLLKRWIAAGAEYQPHWSFIAPKRPIPPAAGLALDGEGWVRNPIDRFVLSGLKKQGLTPAPEADRRTLARRLSLDLTGLPPEPALVEAFVADPAPDAYEQLVDRLMATPEWGEHRARYWLDAARYADTHGIHFDNYRENWAYRDWVIGAFNRNLPFDRFTVEQLAGDILPGADLEQKVASGFNRCNITTNEGGIIDEEYLVLYTRDRTETVSQVWLGLTAGCAVCHDHKFDPLTQKEFYSMAAFFNNTTQNAKDGNIKDTPPTLFVPGRRDRDRWDVLGGLLADVRQKLEARKQAARPEFDRWLAAAKPDALAALDPGEGHRLKARLSDWEASLPATGAELEIADAGDFDTRQAFSYGAWVKIKKADTTGAIVSRMKDRDGFRGWDLWLDKGKVGTHIIHYWKDDALKVVTTVALKPDQWNHVLVTYDGSAKAAGVTVYINGVLQVARPQIDTLKGTIRTDVPLKVGQRETGSRPPDTLIHGLRIFGRVLTAREVEKIAAYDRAVQVVGKAEKARTNAEVDSLFGWWLTALDKPSHEYVTKLEPLEREEAEIKARGTLAHVMHERDEEAMAFILHRGEYDKRRDPVQAGTPAVLPPLPSDLPRNRLGFAQWLLLPEHPLTARVTVNRFWQELFGSGLVRTAGDFGATGEAPSHPELLDWLAVEFREQGWDVKEFFKLLVTSATYRQSVASTAEKREKDPHNRLLSRGPRFRMDAEMVRDYALAASGLLAEKLGGPSVKPYQPDGVWEAVAMIGSNTRNYRRDEGEKLYRRSLYTFWKRAAPPASMDIFNAPSREVCAVRRERTNTPLQALVTLNDPQFVEAARNLAGRTLEQAGPSSADRLAFLAGRVLARPFRAEERAVAEDSLAGLIAHYREHPRDAEALLKVGESRPDPALDAPTLAAWTMLTNELLNLDEVLNK